ncbi:MAG TPA: K(+)-transporting ATPase subunit F [Dehalococcoidales bacterium]|nr:K(+)-transporting ATPase subunit F [Dehalococcoidales bacterium]
MCGSWVDSLRVKYERFIVCIINRGILFADLCGVKVMRLPDGGHKMNVLYITAGIISFILLVYLVLALLKPEWFK